MNKNGQGALEYLILIGGAIVVAAVVIAVVVGINPENEQWVEEWECSNWQDTENLINCHEETRTEERITQKKCSTLGKEWQNVGNWTIIEDRNIFTTPIQIHENICSKKTTEIVCEHEQKCVEQKPRKITYMF